MLSPATKRGLVEQARAAFFLEPKALALDVDCARAVPERVDQHAPARLLASKQVGLATATIQFMEQYRQLPIAGTAPEGGPFGKAAV